MEPSFLELQIEDLLLIQREVRKKTVGKYIMMYLRGERVNPISVTYCVHMGKYCLDNGHHRVVAAHFLGRTSILAKIEPCYLYGCIGVQSECEPFCHIRNIILE